MDLVILAAGMGSRFGGLKQIKEVGPNGEMIIDYSIYDAIKAGFNRVIFIIKKENLNYFKPLENKINKYVKVDYAFQNNDNVPNKYDKLKYRDKPLGTAHALLCAKDLIKDKFMVINADDFYGKESYEIGYNYLKKSNDYGIIGYLSKNTLSENGKVKRGVCEVKDGKLVNITESSLEKKEGKIICTPDNSDEKTTLKEDTLVSMNMLLLDKTIFKYIEKEFKVFLFKNDLNYEFYIPDVLLKVISDRTCKVIKTPSVWYGITYREDLEDLKKNILNLVKSNIYPTNLWK